MIRRVDSNHHIDSIQKLSSICIPGMVWVVWQSQHVLRCSVFEMHLAGDVARLLKANPTQAEFASMLRLGGGKSSADQSSVSQWDAFRVVVDGSLQTCLISFWGALKADQVERDLLFVCPNTSYSACTCTLLIVHIIGCLGVQTNVCTLNLRDEQLYGCCMRDVLLQLKFGS